MKITDEGLNTIEQYADKCKKSVKCLTSDVYNGIIIKLIYSAY